MSDEVKGKAMTTTIIPIEPVEAAAHEMMDALCGSNGWMAPIDEFIPRRMFGLAAIVVDYYTGAELRIVGKPTKNDRVHVHSDGGNHARLRQTEFDALRILAQAA